MAPADSALLKVKVDELLLLPTAVVTGVGEPTALMLVQVVATDVGVTVGETVLVGLTVLVGVTVKVDVQVWVILDVELCVKLTL